MFENRRIYNILEKHNTALSELEHACETIGRHELGTYGKHHKRNMA